MQIDWIGDGGLSWREGSGRRTLRRRSGIEKERGRYIWYRDRVQYVVYPGMSEPSDEGLVEVKRLALAVALASDDATFPEEYMAAPAVVRYLAIREENAPADLGTPDEWLEKYESNLFGQCDTEWAKNSRSYLRRLRDFAGGDLAGVTKAKAVAFLDHLQKSVKAATRNRALAACRRFYNWTIDTGRLRQNPFAGIKQLREVRSGEIVFCSRPERERILKAARSLRPIDAIAVEIAFFAGCRRREIFRLEWRDVNFESRKLIVRITKTGRPHNVDIGKTLLGILKEKRKDHGFAVPALPGFSRISQADEIVDSLREHLSEPLHPGPDGLATEPIGRREFVMSDAERLAVEAEKEKARRAGDYAEKFPHEAPPRAHDNGEWLPGERIGWNAWRHTFGSLLVQDGESLDQVSAWMGNTVEVCRRHYAGFERRKGRSRHIDRL